MRNGEQHEGTVEDPLALTLVGELVHFQYSAFEPGPPNAELVMTDGCIWWEVDKDTPKEHRVVAVPTVDNPGRYHYEVELRHPPRTLRGLELPPLGLPDLLAEAIAYWRTGMEVIDRGWSRGCLPQGM